jgi:hypothetical protein
MPTYLNGTNLPVAIGMSRGRTKILLSGQSFETIELFDDQYPELIRISDAPFDNPLIDRKTFQGQKDNTIIIDVPIITTRIIINATNNVEVYLNSFLNTPPLIVDQTHTIELKKPNRIDKLCFKFVKTAQIDLQFMRE